MDEKSQIQALERTQPLLPMGLGYVEGVTHDYRRHGTTTLFAALDTAKGKVLTQCRQRHRHQEYLDFLREIEKNVPECLEVHIIVDNYATHKHPRVKRWFAARPRFHVHFTPTYASWLNQVEIWFNRITQQAIRRGTFRSVKELVEKIDQYVRASNTHAQPFVWTATADSIFAKVQRLCERISGTANTGSLGIYEELCTVSVTKRDLEAVKIHKLLGRVDSAFSLDLPHVNGYGPPRRQGEPFLPHAQPAQPLHFATTQSAFLARLHPPISRADGTLRGRQPLPPAWLQRRS